VNGNNKRQMIIASMKTASTIVFLEIVKIEKRIVTGVNIETKVVM
jgi:hypothetical protein